VALVVLLVALGLGVRVYALDTFPAGLFYDESNLALGARTIGQNGVFPLWFSNFGIQWGPMLTYPVGLALALGGPNPVLLRLVTVLVGVLTIPLMYLASRELWGRRVGFLAAAVLSVLRWHVNFSRVLFDDVFDPFWALLGLYLLMRALKTGRRSLYVASGMAFAAGLYGYFAYRLVPLVMLAFVLHLVVSERRFLRRTWQGFVLLSLAALLMAAPVAVYAGHHTEDFVRRSKQVLVTNNTPPEKYKEALWNSFRATLWQFHFRGDNNGRHNLPDAPLLNKVFGVVAILGLGLCLSRLHQGRYFLPPVWFAVLVLPGVLTIEAPQAHRTFDAVTSVVWFLALGFDGAWTVLEEAATRLPGRILSVIGRYTVAAGVMVVLVVGGYLDMDLFFRRQRVHKAVFLGFDTRETIIAREVAAGKGQARFYSLYAGHPTMQLLASDVPDNRSFRVLEDLPVRGQVDKDVVYLMVPEFCPPEELFRFYYPGGELRRYNAPWGDTVVFVYRVSRDEVNNTQGLAGRFWAGEEKETIRPPDVEWPADNLDFDWDRVGLAYPLTGRWSGTVYAPQTGHYILAVESPGKARLVVDGETVFDGPGEQGIASGLNLTGGWHEVELTAVTPRSGHFTFSWQPPGGQPQPVPRDVLRVNTLPRHGLLGQYYPNADWAGEPAFVAVDPVVAFQWHAHPLPIPWTVEWVGALGAPASGQYRLIVDGNGLVPAQLELDGELFIDSQGGRVEKVAELVTGWHPVKVRYRPPSGGAHFALKWQPPGGAESVIPTEYLQPVMPGAGERMAVPWPQIKELPEVAEAPPTPLPPPLLGVTYVIGWGGPGSGAGQFNRPRGLTLGPDGLVYVADAGNGRVQVFKPDGTFVWATKAGELSEPWVVAVSRAGEMIVLDSGQSAVVRFDGTGQRLAKYQEGLGLYSPRALALGPEGDLYIADTGTSRVVVLSPDGAVRFQFGHQGEGRGEFVQPGAILVAGERVYVADATHNKRVQVFDLRGQLLSQWPVPWASDFESPMMALGPDGHLYLTDPEHGQVWEYSPEGKPLGRWGTPEALGRPAGIAVDGSGRIYLTDVTGNRVIVFQRGGG